MLFSVAAAAGRRAAGCARLARAVGWARRPVIAQCSRVERCCEDHADAGCTAHQQIAAQGWWLVAAEVLLPQSCSVVAADVDAAAQSKVVRFHEIRKWAVNFTAISLQFHFN